MKNDHFYGLPFLALLQISPSYAVDLQPGEIQAPKSGINFVQLAYQYSKRGDRYSHGEKQSGDTAIQSTQVQIRLGHSFEISQYPALVYVQTPIGYVHPEGSLSRFEGDAGVGDTTFLQAIWPYANRETRTYLGIGTYLIIPTGSYHPERSFNVGENRYRWTLQVGYQTALAERLHAMAAVDASWFSENDEFGQRRDTLKRQVLYVGQMGLRHNINSSYALGATYFFTTGGETRINGVDRDDKMRLHRYQVSGIVNFSFGQVTLQYGNDLETENGYIEDQRWILRYTKSW